MKKVMNFRDLGGAVTLDGKKVKEGLFFRSAMLNDASDEDISFLKSLNLNVIFDYRDEDESVFIKTNPYELIGARYLNLPADMKNDKLYKLKKSSHLARAFYKITLEDVKVSYRNLPFNNEGYKAMVSAMVAGETPFLIHCSAGKDRAGVGSALLLTILGADSESILTDYMKSIDIKAYIEKKIGVYIPKIIRKYILKRFEPLFIVDKSLLDAAFEAIKDKYGTVENYLLNEYGLSEEALKDLRARYTE